MAEYAKNEELICKTTYRPSDMLLICNTHFLWCLGIKPTLGYRTNMSYLEKRRVYHSMNGLINKIMMKNVLCCLMLKNRKKSYIYATIIACDNYYVA